MELKGSKTEKNLWEAFAGESMARNKYTYFASKAKKEGFNRIGEIFATTAHNEEQHAKIWFKILQGGEIQDTATNLQICVDGEHYEHADMYLRMEKEAKEEGFDKIAYLFKAVGSIEKGHEDRYQKVLDALKENKIFTRDTKIVWECGQCGHRHEGLNPPEMCPVCSHPKAYFFELRDEY
jgi:rubrerythrin